MNVLFWDGHIESFKIPKSQFDGKAEWFKLVLMPEYMRTNPSPTRE